MNKDIMSFEEFKKTLEKVVTLHYLNIENSSKLTKNQKKRYKKFLRDFSNPFERIEHKTIDETKEILKEFADHFNNMIDSLDDAESLLNELYPDKDIVMWVEFDSDDFYVTFQERKIESDEQFEKSAKEYYNEYLEDIEDERLRKEKELEKAKIQYEMELEAIKNQYENRLKDINSNR